MGAFGGAGAVPFSAIDRYAARYGIEDLEEFDRFRRMIRAQDRAYLKDAANRMKNNDKTGKSKAQK